MKRTARTENQVLAAAAKYRKWFVIGPIFKLTEAILELLIPTLMVSIVDRGVTGRDGSYVLKMLPLMVGIAVVGYLSALVCQYVASLSSQGFGTELRNRLFRHTLAIRQKDADRFGAPTMVNRITSDVNVLQQAVAMLIRLAIRAPFICIGSLVMAACLNLRLTLVILCALPLLIGITWLIMKLTVPLFAKVQQKLDKLAVISRENMSGARVIRAFSRKKDEQQRFSDESEGYSRAAIRVNRISTLLNPLTTLIMNIAVICVLWFGGLLIEGGSMTGGRIIAFVNYISYMVTALLVVANLVTLFTKARASYRRVNEVFAVPAGDNTETANTMGLGDNAEPASPAGAGDNAEPASPVGAGTNAALATGTDLPAPDVPAVEFNNAALRYGDDSSVPPAVEGLNFTLRRGEVLGIVGITGSGKTSLVSLLTRLYDCTDGTVSVLGRDVRAWDVRKLHKTVRVAAQQSMLFAGTVGDNLRAGDSSITDDDINEALKLALADGFVAEKGGLDAPVERGGVNFSGGQRQRLCVARAVAGFPRVLVLDDSFSALDNATASSMFRALRATAGREKGIETLIIVSQRVGNVRAADRILVLDDGRMAGLGTHAELLENCPQYAEICRLSEGPGDSEPEGAATDAVTDADADETITDGRGADAARVPGEGGGAQ